MRLSNTAVYQQIEIMHNSKISILALLAAILLAGFASAQTGNSLRIISPYYSDGTWVFDDPSVDLVKEPFVLGIPEMIDTLVRDLPNPKNGFRLLFSDKPFPGYQTKVVWVRKDDGAGGNWYRFENTDMEGWLCPSLFKYFEEAPKEIFIKASAKNE